MDPFERTKMLLVIRSRSLPVLECDIFPASCGDKDRRWCAAAPRTSLRGTLPCLQSRLSGQHPQRPALPRRPGPDFAGHWMKRLCPPGFRAFIRRSNSFRVICLLHEFAGLAACSSAFSTESTNRDHSLCLSHCGSGVHRSSGLAGTDDACASVCLL